MIYFVRTATIADSNAALLKEATDSGPLWSDGVSDSYWNIGEV